MSEIIKYDDLKHTKFPLQVDKLKYIRDPKDSEIPLINQYNTYMSTGQVATAIEILVKNPSLKECLINADMLLSMHHSIIATQRYFFDNIQEKIFRIGKLKGVWNNQMSSDSEDENLRLDKFDVVRYPVDEINQYFLVYGDDVPQGINPIDGDKYYLQISMKGETGEQGYTPVKNIDYYDGASGLGLSPRGVWIDNITYSQYDLVSYNGYLWYCLEENMMQEPNDDSEIWVKIEISLQNAIGSEIPANLAEGGTWLHMQDDGHVIIKSKSNDGTFTTIYPETQASYVFDNTGTSLQKKIYQHYFDRDDIKIVYEDNNTVYTTTAVLLNTSIVVAKSIVTDNTNINNTMMKEFIIYDETGIYILYHCIDTYEIDEENGIYTKIPKVIV